jgi:DNA-directed RNA polymerase specialized sigma24 family protein
MSNREHNHPAAAGGMFPITRHSAIRATRSADATERAQAYETILASYWKPTYKYLRLKYGAANEDAEDLTQGFFAAAFEKGYFEKYDPTKASFHVFLRTCLDRFVSNERKAHTRQKRGGDSLVCSLDFAGAETEFKVREPPGGISPEDYFHQEWVRSLFSAAVTILRERYEATGKQTHFALFELYDLDEHREVSYDVLAQRFGLRLTDVTNYLAAARREFRKIVLDQLRQITASDDEFRRETRSLLGVDPS